MDDDVLEECAWCSWWTVEATMTVGICAWCWGHPADPCLPRLDSLQLQVA